MRLSENPLQVEEEAVIQAEIVPAVEDKPKKRGKPSKFTPTLVKNILKSLDKGLPFNHACALAGIHPTSGQRYLAQGAEDPDGPMGEFALEVYKRRAQYMEGLIEEWRETASMTKQWAGLATLAERLDPENFSQKKNQTNVAVQVNVGSFEKKLHEIQTQTTYDGG